MPKTQNPPLTRPELAQVIAARIAVTYPDSDPQVGEEDGKPVVRLTLGPAADPWHATVGTGNHWHDFQRGLPLETILRGVTAALADLLAAGNAPDVWTTARAHLTIQLQTAADSAAVQRDAARVAPHDRVLARPWAFGVVAKLCVDAPHSILTVTSAHVRRWGVDEATVWRVALANARRAAARHTGTRVRHSDAATFRHYDAPTGYVATRVLWPELLPAPAATRRRLLCVPERDLVFVADISYAKGAVPIMAAVGSLAVMYKQYAGAAYQSFPYSLVLIEDPDTRRWRQIYPPAADPDALAPPADALIPPASGPDTPGGDA